MTTPILVTGDALRLPMTLTVDGAVFAIDSLATVRAALVTKDHRTLLAGPVAVLEAAVGSDWANSLVVIEFDPDDTADVTHQGPALIELEVDDNGPRTWFAPVQVVTGMINPTP